MDLSELENAIRKADAAGASKDEMKKLQDFYMQTVQSQGSTKQPEADKPGFLKSVIQETAKPFLKVAASASNIVGAPIAAAMGKTDEYNKKIQEGVDYGFFGKVSPIGTAFTDEELSTGQKIGRTAADLSGTMAEIASYGLAPLKGVKGMGFFETAVKAGWKPSLALGAGKTLQAKGEGDGTLDALAQGAGAALGSSIGFGIAGKGSQLIGNWGAKAVQSNAVRAAGTAIKDVAEKIWTAMPESFQQKGFQIADAVLNSSTRRAVDALKSEYGQAHKQAINAWIESTAPNVDRPDLALGEFQRSLSAEMGGMFRKSATLYDDFKAANPISENASEWGVTNAAIDKIPKESGLKYFFTGLKQSLGKPTSPRQILSVYEQLMSDVQTAATNEEKNAIREVANSLYTDMRSILKTKDESLLNKWDEAYQSWKKATDIYESNPMNQIKTSGDVDTIVDKMATNKMTRSEQQVLFNAMKDNPEPVRNLVVSSLLRKAKGMEPEQGSKLIRDFLDSWDFKAGDGQVTNGFLDPKQTKYLDDIASYMEENFTEFTNGMRKAVGVADETTEKLTEQQAKLNISELVDKGDFDAIAQNWSKISGTEDFAGALKILKPEEKRVVGLSIWRKMFNEELPLFTKNSDGTVNFESFATAFKEAFSEVNRVGGDKKGKLLEDLYSDEQIKAFNEANKMLQTFDDVKQVPASSVKKMMHGALAVYYTMLGNKYVGAAARHGTEAAAPSAKTFYQGVDKLVEQGLLKKNFGMKASDIMRELETTFGEAVGQSSSELTQ